MIKFTKINFLLSFYAAALAFGTAIASILVKTLHPKKDVGNFFRRIAPKGTATHTAVNCSRRRRIFISERAAA